MEVHLHLKNAFQAELETEGSRLATIFGLPPTPQRGCLSFGSSFFSLFFFKKTSAALLKLWEVEDFANLGTPVCKKCYVQTLDGTVRLEASVECVLLCFIKLILGNRYGPGVIP